MPAVTAAEPGGFKWYELLSSLRALFRRCEVVGADVVGLSPIPGLVAPNFMAAKLVYKLLTYRLAQSG
jgi:agmatinase